MNLTQYMGQILGPRPQAEIVITFYEDEKINYQIEGMHGPVAPETAFRLLRAVMQEIIKSAPQPTVIQPTQDTTGDPA